MGAPVPALLPLPASHRLQVYSPLFFGLGNGTKSGSAQLSSSSPRYHKVVDQKTKTQVGVLEIKHSLTAALDMWRMLSSYHMYLVYKKVFLFTCVQRPSWSYVHIPYKDSQNLPCPYKGSGTTGLSITGLSKLQLASISTCHSWWLSKQCEPEQQHNSFSRNTALQHVLARLHSCALPTGTFLQSYTRARAVASLAPETAQPSAVLSVGPWELSSSSQQERRKKAAGVVSSIPPRRAGSSPASLIFH